MARAEASFVRGVIGLLLAAGVLGPAHARGRAQSSPSTAASEAAVLFSDDFSGQAIDRQKWNVIVTGETVNDEQQAYVDSPDTLAIVTGEAAQGARNGALEIRSRYRPGFKTPQGKVFDFISGRLDTRGKFDFTYGTAAARVKLTAGAGIWPAFWTLGNDGWPETGEMDILENVGDPAWTNFALHGPGYSGANGIVGRHYFQSGGGISDWHVYALSWGPSVLLFSVDGTEAFRVTRETVEAHGRWAFDTPKHVIVNQAVGGVYPHAINKADRPYFGLPQTTVDLIKADKAVMLVDWISVTRSNR
jgi:beta-glucanase (GH16 family)